MPEVVSMVRLRSMVALVVVALVLLQDGRPGAWDHGAMMLCTKAVVSRLNS